VPKRSVSVWPCSGRGLPGRPVTRPPWALTPPFHRCPDGSGAVSFLWHSPSVTPTGRYPAPCSAEPGLSSDACVRDRLPACPSSLSSGLLATVLHTKESALMPRRLFLHAGGTARPPVRRSSSISWCSPRCDDPVCPERHDGATARIQEWLALMASSSPVCTRLTILAPQSAG